MSAGDRPPLKAMPRRSTRGVYGSTPWSLYHHAGHRMLEAPTSAREPQNRSLNEGVSSFNTLLRQAKEEFRGSDTLRLIEPLGRDASAALIAVRLSMVKRTIDAELARSTEEAS